MRPAPVLLACLAFGLAVPACGASGPAGATSATTARSATAERPVTLWAVGDADAGGAARGLAALVRRQRPSRFLYLGDVYETGTPQQFRAGYDPLYGSLARRTIPTPGNHEWPNREIGYLPYWRRGLGRPVAWWSRTRVGAGWEVLSLNSEAPHGPGSEQLRWLAAATARPGTCRIAIWHRPRWSSGWHGDQADMAPVWSALRGRARLVLSGHDHDLQRFADRDGLRQYVSGGGGRPNIPIPHRSAARVRFVNRLSAGGLQLRLTRGRASLAFVDGAGRVLDRSSATCRPVS